MDGRDRYRGALLGLAVGDALGTTLEFKPPGTFEPITDIVGGGPFGLQPGQWTDDTSMALCLAESLVDLSGLRRGRSDAALCALVSGGLLEQHRHPASTSGPQSAPPCAASSATATPLPARPMPAPLATAP